jgi:hypothetical protein
MVCVHVPLPLKQNVGILCGVLRGPRNDVPFIFFACYGSAIILWVFYLCITYYISVSANLFETGQTLTTRYNIT